MKRYCVRRLALILIVGYCLPASAEINLSESPLFLSVNVAPNVLMTFDDSGSMERGYVPDSINDDANTARFTAASYNGLYYNPLTVYRVPERKDEVVYSTRFSNALVNGFDPSRGTVNLGSSGYRPITRCDPAQTYSSCDKAAGTSIGSQPETYTYTGCRAVFDDRGSDRDRITITRCGMPSSGSGAPSAADNDQILAANAGSYSRSYTVRSVSSTSGGVQINLDTTSEIRSDSTQNGVTFSWTATGSSRPAMAFYHLYYTSKPGAARPAGCNDSRETDACYILIESGTAADITPGTVAQQQQNFANWYSFYRTRALATMSAAMTAVTSLGTDQVRLGWQTINACRTFGTSCTGTDGVQRENRIRTLDAPKTGYPAITHRTDFYDWLTRMRVNGGTQLRSSLQNAGDYFTLSGRESPYADEPYVTSGEELSCRKSFNVVFTDGYWNGDSNIDFGGDTDSNSQALPDGKTYSPRYPYRNGSDRLSGGLSNSNSLADIAFKYWYTDLRPDAAMENNVAPYVVDRSGGLEDQYWNPRNDPASWQHLVNFFISLGLGSSMSDPLWGGSTFAGDYPLLASGEKFWPPIDESADLSQSPQSHVYDLWHAAINSRGQFFSADDPDAMNNAFRAVFDSILSATPSAAALAANSTSIQTGTLLYQARFDSSDWHGQLVAYSVQADGAIGNVQWDASKRMPAPLARSIWTWNGSAGVAFSSCGSLAGSQKAGLDLDVNGIRDNRCDDRLAWLRGEQRAGLRERQVSVLGDIINSDPLFVQDEDFGYEALLPGSVEAAQYPAFLALKSMRTPMVYVGANDGMLHAFRGDLGSDASGREAFAFIPASLYPKLSRLTDPGYSHSYYVDGAPMTGDAWLNGRWRSVLVGGLGAGGKSIYALDVTDPDNFDAADVLWEFEDAEDLGYTFSQPQIARLNNGVWAAVFGNGYNSVSDQAFIYIVNLENGALVRKIAAGSMSGNGLSTPVLFDRNGDRVMDVIYAGDLRGNLWEFDLSSASEADWQVANLGQPLFSAVNQSGEMQPITAQPGVIAASGNPPNGGVMVYFGTGRYLAAEDTANTDVQSFYAIWDSPAGGVVDHSQLQQQSMISETAEFGFDVRETTSNSVDWSRQRGWYMDLVVPPIGAEGPGGERVVSRPLLKYDRVIFVTQIPSAEPCVPGGTSWIMEVDMLTGAPTLDSPFDFNHDNIITDGDRLASGRVASGVKSTVGMTKTPTWLNQASTPEIGVKELSGTSGGIMSLKNRRPIPPGIIQRIFWQQIQ